MTRVDRKAALVGDTHRGRARWEVLVKKLALSGKLRVLGTIWTTSANQAHAARTITLRTANKCMERE